MCSSAQKINAISLEAISKYSIATKVPIHGEITVPELAKQCDLYEPDMRRIVRFAIVHHRIFQEKTKNVISHSAASRKLAEDQIMQDQMSLQFEESWQSFARVSGALASNDVADT